MGENTETPKDNKKKLNIEHMQTQNTESPSEENMETNSDDNPNEEEDNFDDMSPEEFAALDNQLDALNSALDDIEQKNDDIHAQLLQLLVANREIRQQLQLANSADQPEQNQNESNTPK